MEMAPEVTPAEATTATQWTDFERVYREELAAVVAVV